MKLGAFDVSSAARTCAAHRCLNDTRDGVAQSLPNPLNGPISLGASGIQVRGVLRLDVNIRLDPAIKDTADFFSQRIATGRALTCNSDHVDEFWAGARGTRAGLWAEGTPCANVGTGQVGRNTDRRRLKRARALLEMFEEDCGRRAVTVEELREWMGAQYTDQLQIRMNRRLHGIDAGVLR